MTDQPQVDTQDDAHVALIEKARSLGIKQASNMKLETLEKRIAKAETTPQESPKEEPKAPALDVVISKEGKAFIDSIKFNYEWLPSIANQYGFTKLEYVHKFRSFRCYKDGKHVEWIDLNELSLLNAGRRICEILLKHQPVSPKRKLIDLPWR